MQVNITTRHCNVPEQVKAEAEERVQRLAKYEPRVDNALIEFDDDHGDKLVETRVHVAGSHSIVAHASGETFESALMKSLDRVATQLKRHHERLRERK
jgi:ribosomal subunit interface protein